MLYLGDVEAEKSLVFVLFGDGTAHFLLKQSEICPRALPHTNFLFLLDLTSIGYDFECLDIDVSF